MSVPFWPAELPQRVLADGFSHALQDNVLSPPMEKGVPKFRRRTTRNVEPISAKIMVDATRWARFRRFFEDETASGSRPFWLPDQVFDGRPLTTVGGLPLTTAGGEPIVIRARWLALFKPGEPPRLGNNRGEWFDLSFDLLRLP